VHSPIPPEQQPLLTSPSGLRWQLLAGEADDEEREVLAAAIDRLVNLERADRPSPWARTARPGAGTRAWSSGQRWAGSVRGDWGRIP
jgi:hypothetical protein